MSPDEQVKGTIAARWWAIPIVATSLVFMIVGLAFSVIGSDTAPLGITFVAVGIVGIALTVALWRGRSARRRREAQLLATGTRGELTVTSAKLAGGRIRRGQINTLSRNLEFDAGDGGEPVRVFAWLEGDVKPGYLARVVYDPVSRQGLLLDTPRPASEPRPAGDPMQDLARDIGLGGG